jgi:hypothetical protein
LAALTQNSATYFMPKEDHSIGFQAKCKIFRRILPKIVILTWTPEILLIIVRTLTRS